MFQTNSQHTNWRNGNGAGRYVPKGASGIGVHDHVPKLGYREYWYPAVEDKLIKRKPVSLKLLGEQVAFFVVAKYGRVDVLVNNVGGTIWVQPYHKYTEEQVNLELEGTLYPTLWYCLAVLPIMMEQGFVSIVNLGLQAPRGLHRLPYAVGSGIFAMTRVLAMEHGGYGMRVNAVSTGRTAIPDRITSWLPLAME